MKLVEALRIVSGASRNGSETLKVALVCGFQPLHLNTFLHASLQLLFPSRRVEIITGLFGDIPGTLEDLKERQLEAMALVLEWDDLDPRLGLRQLGGWGAEIVEDSLVQSKMRLSQFEALLREAAKAVPIVVSLPTLPLPPLFVNKGYQIGHHELSLRQQICEFASAISQSSGIRLVSQQRLDWLSAPSERLDVKSAWTSGFPYETTHASALAEVLARLIQNPGPMKGLITDLDNTLWNGIVGEDGPEGVNWDLEHHSQGHGLYQQIVAEFSEEGVLVAVASKNEQSVVDDAFAREDILLAADKVFPLAVNWGSKARSISMILTQWNIGPESVVFIDDDPLELEEVRTMFPQMTCLQFPKGDPRAIYELLVRLRDLFGKDSISEEDKLRLQSIRANASIQAASGEVAGFSEALLERAQAELTFTLAKNIDDRRAFELINKTNQFNLNGRRQNEAAWNNYLSKEDTFIVTIDYKDRFGPLGKIAVIAGRTTGSALRVEFWVMSCRAFARRIEYQALRFLFSTFGVNSIELAYEQTSRNGPLASFLTELLGAEPFENIELQREGFETVCPRLFHRVLGVQ
jgi:FkbH-like protein